MKILNVEPKDIHVTLDMSIAEVNMVLDALEHAEIKFPGDEKPELKDAAKFLGDVFFKTLSDLSKELKG